MYDLIFYENRRTPEVVRTGQPGKKGGVGTAAGRVVKRRPATAKELEDIRKGKWLRVNRYGNTPKDDSYKSKVTSKVRPQNN